MKIELRQLMDENEMLSHIFLGCIQEEKLIEIKEKFVGKEGQEKDWEKEINWEVENPLVEDGQ